jgi:hypothetical protein
VPVNLIQSGNALDLLPLLNARQDLAQRLVTTYQRLALWLNGLMNGIQIEDPVVRTMIWSLVLWLIAAWAGWQIFRNNRLLAGMLPSTVMLAFVVEYTARESQVLWIHLALLLFLYGLTSYASLLTRWKTSRMDYADSTSIDTLGFVGALSVGLVAVAFLFATISVRDILENLRDRTQESNTTQAESLGLESDEDNFRVMGFSSGLPRLYRLRLEQSAIYCRRSGFRTTPVRNAICEPSHCQPAGDLPQRHSRPPVLDRHITARRCPLSSQLDPRR